jgi:hypothetical protein
VALLNNAAIRKSVFILEGIWVLQAHSRLFKNKLCVHVAGVLFRMKKASPTSI